MYSHRYKHSYHGLHHLHALAAQFGDGGRDVQLGLGPGLLQGTVQGNEGSGPTHSSTGGEEGGKRESE